MPALALFWTSVFLLGYGHLGYPALIRAWAALRPRMGGWWHREPTVTILVVVHDEAARIEGRIANLLALEYPGDRLEIVVASDGSTDDTLARARAFEGAGVRVIGFAARRGKAAVLNDLIPGWPGGVVVLADARQRFEAGRCPRLLRPLAAREGAA